MLIPKDDVDCLPGFKTGKLKLTNKIITSLFNFSGEGVGYRIIQRLLDIVIFLAAFILTAPIMLAIAIIIKLDSPGPAIFRHVRTGIDRRKRTGIDRRKSNKADYNGIERRKSGRREKDLFGKQFVFYKFRTMTDKRDKEGHHLPDEKRLTRFGRFLRSTSLDELPELFNVIKGDMSLIGPRPLLMQYLERYTPEQARRHEVKPGITGWAQINGRNAITWEEKFALDVWYIDNQTMFLDIKILALTMIKIIKREGINYPGPVSAEEFNPQPTGFKADEKMTIKPDK